MKIRVILNGFSNSIITFHDVYLIAFSWNFSIGNRYTTWRSVIVIENLS